MEDQFFDGNNSMSSEELHAYSYAEVFGTQNTLTIPFGLIMKAIVSLADLSIGVPAGPFHLSMAKAELPTVGIWLTHLPNWYDEPKQSSIHLIGQEVRSRGLEKLPGSFYSAPDFNYRVRNLFTRTVSGEHVLNAVEELLY